MKRTSNLMVRTAAIAVVVSMGAGSAMAGGFFVREQGALGQGSSFAGAGASNALSAMFFNSAAVTSLDGMNADSSYSLALPDATLTAQTGSSFYGVPSVPQSTQIGVDAVIPATYMNYQFKSDPRLYLGLGLNSGFGLKTEPDKRWAGSNVASSTRLFTLNVNPVLGYKLSDQISVAVGAQFEYAKGVLKFATGNPASPLTAPFGPHTFYEGNDIAVGGTAGITYTPNPGTRIGLGYRSQITHTLEGTFATNIPGALQTGVRSKVDINLPDIVNLSLNQAVAPNMRVLATVEWANWSRFKELNVIADGTGVVVTKGPGLVTPGQSVGVIPANWDDGWFFSGGLEYDYSNKLTLRAGGAYEISPIQSATARIASIPDADRIWASLGFSYNWSQSTTLDFGYSHVFVEDAKIDRKGVTGAPTIKADLDASVDILSLGVRMKLN